MSPFITFTKKEFLESLRTHRFYVLCILFALFAIMSPAAAKLMPKLLEATLPEGMQLSMNDPTALDSWQQFFKNMGQMGMVTIVIMYSSILTAELKKGTLINLVTKGLNRFTILFAKFTAAVLTWSAVYWIGFLISYAYTIYYWDGDIVKHLLPMVACVWVFGIMLISVLLLASTLLSSTYGALLGTGAVVAIMLFLQIIPSVNKYNPVRLIQDNYAVVSGSMEAGDLLRPVIITIIVIVASLGLSCIFFHKKRL